MRYQGKITHWKDDQGFGFINPNGGGKGIFVHIKSFSKGLRRPTDGDIVTYAIKTDDKGRQQAEIVAFVAKPSSASNSVAYGHISLLISAVFLAFVGISVFIGTLAPMILWLYLTASAIAFIMYYRDKSAAKNNEWRTAENSLHLLALVGGWPGALTAQKLLSHKSKKQSFQIIFWMTVALNCGALGWVFSHPSNQFTQIISTFSKGLIKTF